MKLFTRTPADPATAQAQIEHARLVAQFGREQRAAVEQERKQQQAERETERAKRREQRQVARAAAWTRARMVLPLLLINAGAAYSQAGYAYEGVAPDVWNVASKLAFALAFATALESVSIYVQWHAHDALMNHAHATAGKLRRASWLIAAVIAGINYAHWAGAHLAPTAAAVAFGLLSLLSPWLWGLHTRRAQHVQLLAEDADLVDNAGAEFSPERRRAFPIRSYMARRWSIDHGVRNPQEAWDGYKAERERLRSQRPAGWWRGKPLAARKPVTVAATSRPSRQPVERTSTATVAARKPPAVAAKKRSPVAARVERVLAEQPDATAPVIAAKIKAPERTVSYHMAAIRKAAAVEQVNGSTMASTT